MNNEHSTKYHSTLQETTISNYLGWKRVSGSGSRSGHPGDIESDEWLGECKTHETAGYNIQFNICVWQKIVDEALSKFKYPVLIADDGSKTIQSAWCMTSGMRPIHVDNVQLIQFPDKFKRKNYSFSALKILQFAKDQGVDVGQHTWTYSDKLDGRIVYITPLVNFRELFLFDDGSVR